jgi:3-oxoacyl-[acyl-carrier protein] reductase
MRFKGKVAVVFAASRGIGRAVAERLGQDGAAVAVNYASNRQKANEVVAALDEAGGQAVAVQGDVANAADVARVFDEAIRRWARVDIVVNAAGVAVFKPTTELIDEDYERVFAVNARGALNVLREAARRVGRGGRIVQFSTGGTKMSTAGAGLYAASKAAGEQLALGLSKELGPRGITVNVISPGATDTDGLIMPKEAIEQMVGMTPLGRLGQPPMSRTSWPSSRAMMLAGSPARTFRRTAASCDFGSRREGRSNRLDAGSAALTRSDPALRIASGRGPARRARPSHSKVPRRKRSPRSAPTT